MGREPDYGCEHTCRIVQQLPFAVDTLCRKKQKSVATASEEDAMTLATPYKRIFSASSEEGEGVEKEAAADHRAYELLKSKNKATDI